MADGELTILELASLPSLETGTATLYEEQFHYQPPNPESFSCIQAHGTMTDGRSFSVRAIENAMSGTTCTSASDERGNRSRQSIWSLPPPALLLAAYVLIPARQTGTGPMSWLSPRRGFEGVAREDKLRVRAHEAD